MKFKTILTTIMQFALFMTLTSLVSFSMAHAENLKCESLFIDNESADATESHSQLKQIHQNNQNFPFERGQTYLTQFYYNEIRNKSISEIGEMNNHVITTMNQYIPPAQEHRAQSVFWGVAQRLIDITNQHDVVGRKNYDKYNQPGLEIGYCFGRAMYIHLTSLKMGLQKESIKKIWAVGPMNSNIPGIIWQFHVATMILTKYDGWVVLDTSENKPVQFEKWIRHFQSRSTDQRIRFYITEPEKFSIDLGKYDRVNLGLDLPINEDWYRHYFVDMLKAVRTEKLEDLGLGRLKVENSYIDPTDQLPTSSTPQTFIQVLRDFFWF